MIRAPSLVFATLLASCDSSSSPSPCEARVRRAGDVASADPLCETQSLVAPLHPGETVEFALAPRKETYVQTCFRDDDGEAHQLSFRKGTEAVFATSADSPCATVKLDMSVYTVRLVHAKQAGVSDSLPDTIHAGWESVGTQDGIPVLRLNLSTNSCPGCDLSNQDWPVLDAPNQISGWVGNYTGAKFGTRCTNRTCSLGAKGTQSSFANISFAPGTFPKQTDFAYMGRNDDDNFEQASFGTVVFAGVVQFQGRYIGADLSNCDPGPEHRLGPGDFHTAKILGPHSNTRVAMLGFLDANVVSYYSLRKYELLDGAGIYIDPNSAVDGVSVDGKVHRVQWNASATGVPTAPKLSAIAASFRNVNVPCYVAGGGDLSGSHFDGATFENVQLAGCNLSGSTFDGATFRNVDARRVNLSETSFARGTFENLNLAESSITSSKKARFSSMTAARNVNLSGAKFNLDASTTIFVNLVAFKADLSGAIFNDCQLLGANFNQTKLDTSFLGRATILDRATFTNAAGTADFSLVSFQRGRLDGARLVDATFRGADLAGTSFGFGSMCGGTIENIRLEGADLSGTLMPAVDTRYVVDGKEQTCKRVTGRTLTVQTNAQTYCPDGCWTV
jgi:uncharacterized protein YjbI with pentapeptide repeats